MEVMSWRKLTHQKAEDVMKLLPIVVTVDGVESFVLNRRQGVDIVSQGVDIVEGCKIDDWQTGATRPVRIVDEDVW